MNQITADKGFARVNTFQAVIRNLMYTFMCRLDVSSNSVIVALVNPSKSSLRYTSSLRKHWLKEQVKRPVLNYLATPTSTPPPVL